MASIPTQEEVLAATRKGQEAMMAAIKTWLETVRTAAPKLPSKLPQVSLPFADKLPTPQDAVANAYHLAEQLLASQRRFAEELVKATAPLRAGYRESSPEVPSRSAWQDAVTDSKPQTPAVSAAPKAVTSTEPKAAVSTAPKTAPARPAAKSTPTRTAPRTAAAKRSAAGSASTTATSARKSATGSSVRKSTTASSASSAGSAGSAQKSAGTTTPAAKGTDKS
jgi:DNA-binding protein HU-beta